MIWAFWLKKMVRISCTIAFEDGVQFSEHTSFLVTDDTESGGGIMINKWEFGTIIAPTPFQLVDQLSIVGTERGC